MMNIQHRVVTLYLLPEIWDLLLATSCCDNIPDYGNLRREGLILAHNSRSQHIVVGKSRRQEGEAAGHIASVVKSREQRVSACTVGLGTFCTVHSLQGPVRKMVLSTFQVTLPISVNPTEKTAQRRRHRLT